MNADTIAGSPKANEAAIKLSQPSGQQHDRSRKFSFYFLLCSPPFVFHLLFVFLCLSTKLPAGLQQALTTVVVIYIFRSIWFPFEAITFVFRVDIWCNYRMCKILASSVIFSRNNTIYGVLENANKAKLSIFLICFFILSSWLSFTYMQVPFDQLQLVYWWMIALESIYAILEQI